MAESKDRQTAEQESGLELVNKEKRNSQTEEGHPSSVYAVTP